MNRLLVLLACLLLAAAPLRGHAPSDCCPPDRSAAHHAHHAHGAPIDPQAQADDDDEACTRLACALHCAGASALAGTQHPSLPAATRDWRGDPFHTRPPAVPPLVPERPPRRLPI